MNILLERHGRAEVRITAARAQETRGLDAAKDTEGTQAEALEHTSKLRLTRNQQFSIPAAMK